MSTLTDIMNEPANVEEIIRKANEINERLKEVENMPRLEKALPSWFYDDVPDHGICPICCGGGCTTCGYTGEV